MRLLARSACVVGVLIGILAVCVGAVGVAKSASTTGLPGVLDRTGWWDAAADFRVSPNQANPSPDRYTNPGVWSYLASASFAHNPGAYSLMPNYSIDGLQWNDPAYVNLLVGISPTYRPLIVMHSYGGRVINDGRMAILAWTSPISSSVTVRGSVELPDLSACSTGGGIIWSIDKGTQALSQSVLPAGGSDNFRLIVKVVKGDTLYFIHDPGFDSNCDSASVNLVISSP